MSKGLLPVARFPLPDNWTPEGMICATFVIPDDPEYLAVITGLVDELKWSRSFARDETGTGAATVARTWQTALESQPVFTQGCDMPEFRIGEDCLLEVNCGTDEVPDWQPVFSGDHPEGDPETPYPPDTEEYGDDTARCITAANIAAQLKYGTETLANDAVIVGGITIAIIDLIGAFLFFVPGGVLVDIAIAIINLAVGHVASDFTDDLPELDWEDVRDNLACFMSRDGSITEAGKAQFLDWMDTQYPGNLAWELTKIIVRNVTADGLTTDARIPQDDIAIDGCPDCEAPSCVWNFEADSMPYTLANGVVEDGVGIDGGHAATGELEDSVAHPGNWQRIIRFKAVVTTAGHLDTVSFMQKWHNTYDNYNTPALGVDRPGTGNLFFNIVGMNLPDGDWDERNYAPNIDLEPGDEINIYIGYDNFPTLEYASSGYIYLDDVIIEPCELFE